MSLFGGDSSSSVKQFDNRAVVDALGQAVSGSKNAATARDMGVVVGKKGSNKQTFNEGYLVDGSNIGGNLIFSDQGAIAAAFDFARQTSAAASAQFDSVFQTAGSLVEQGADMNDTDKQNRKTLMIGAGVVVALVALWILNK